MKIILLNTTRIKNIPPKKEFSFWVNAVIHAIPEKIPASCNEISISIIDEETSATLNQTYRHKTGPTNVLSFPYDPMPGIPQESLGDLAICAAVVEAEAAAQDKALIAHWAHLCIHGTLHLLGYDHLIDHEAEIMESLEVAILASIGFENPYL